MAVRTYVSTPVREAALSAAVADANAAVDAQNAVLAAQKPPGTPLTRWTNDNYWQARNDDVLDSYGAGHRQQIAGTCVAAFARASPSAQAQVLALLGMTAYAGLPPADLANALAAVGLPAFTKLTPDQQNQAFTLVGLG